MSGDATRCVRSFACINAPGCLKSRRANKLRFDAERPSNAAGLSHQLLPGDRPGVLQGVSELFPISSLGHTVLFPTLFGWNRLVKAQSESESFWLAFVVMLHVGSALGLLAYYWRDWVQIVRAFFRTLVNAPDRDLHGAFGLADHRGEYPRGRHRVGARAPTATLTAKPEIAAIFLMVNGLLLFAAERFRRRAQVRELAAREGPSRTARVSSPRWSTARRWSLARRSRRRWSPASAVTV